MIFHENRLLADDSHVISCLIFSKIREDVAKFVVCCSHDLRVNIGLRYRHSPYYITHMPDENCMLLERSPSLE